MNTDMYTWTCIRPFTSFLVFMFTYLIYPSHFLLAFVEQILLQSDMILPCLRLHYFVR